MSRNSDDPVRHIVTFRVNSEEKRVLKQLVKKSGITVSEYMRWSLQLISKNEQLKS